MAVCKHCGKEFKPKKTYQKFCSDACRKRDFADAKLRERKEARQARRANSPQPQPRKLYDNVLDATDPRRRLTKMRARGLLSPEYWTLYAQVDKLYNGGNGIVCGIATTDPNFTEEVLALIYVNGRVICWTEKAPKK